MLTLDDARRIWPRYVAQRRAMMEDMMSRYDQYDQAKAAYDAAIDRLDQHSWNDHQDSFRDGYYARMRDADAEIARLTAENGRLKTTLQIALNDHRKTVDNMSELMEQSLKQSGEYRALAERLISQVQQLQEALRGADKGEK